MSNIFSNNINRDFSDIGRSNVISSNAMLASSHPIASSVGIEIFDDQFEDLKVENFPIFSYQESMDKVQTNNLTNVHLGSYCDRFFGKIN